MHVNDLPSVVAEAEHGMPLLHKIICSRSHCFEDIDKPFSMLRMEMGNQA